jgi:hypothetical protein
MRPFLFFRRPFRASWRAATLPTRERAGGPVLCFCHRAMLARRDAHRKSSIPWGAERRWATAHRGKPHHQNRNCLGVPDPQAFIDLPVMALPRLGGWAVRATIAPSDNSVPAISAHTVILKYFADDKFMCHPATFLVKEYVCLVLRREPKAPLNGLDVGCLGGWSEATRYAGVLGTC